MMMRRMAEELKERTGREGGRSRRKVAEQGKRWAD